MVSALNFSLTFVVFCALAGSFVSPVPHPDANTIAFTGNLEKSAKQFQTHLVDAVKNFTRTSDWILNHLQTVALNIMKEGFEYVGTWGVDVLMRMEMCMIADGSHYTLPKAANLELEAQYKTISIAVSKVLRNLKTTKKADILITEAARKLVQEPSIRAQYNVKGEEKVVEKLFKTILQKYFQIVDELFTANSEVGVEYKKQVVEATELVKQNPTVDEPLVFIGSKKAKTLTYPDVEAFLKGKVVLRQVIANKLFLKQSVKNVFMIISKTEHTRFLMACALLQKAALNDSGADKINEIYQKALLKGGEVKIDQCSWVITDTLFDAIEKGLESEPKLQTEIQVLMKEIESKTVYDIGMLHVDFSPL